MLNECFSRLFPMPGAAPAAGTVLGWTQLLVREAHGLRERTARANQADKHETRGDKIYGESREEMES